MAGMWDFLFSADFLCFGFDFPLFFFTFCVHKYRNTIFSTFFLSSFLFSSFVMERYSHAWYGNMAQTLGKNAGVSLILPVKFFTIVNWSDVNEV